MHRYVKHTKTNTHTHTHTLDSESGLQQLATEVLTSTDILRGDDLLGVCGVCVCPGGRCGHSAVGSFLPVTHANEVHTPP